MTEAIPFRPHHFLCALGFRGKGYADAFTANMADIVKQLRGPEGDQVLLEVTRVADAICAPCPHRRGTGCAEIAKITALDTRHAQALGLEAGMQLSWREAQARIRAQVAPGDLAQLCAGCQWLELGLCESALSALHEAQKSRP